MKPGMINTGYLAAILFSVALLASCNSGYKKADLTVVDFPTYDSTQFDPIDKPGGKLFDILSSATTGLVFSNDVGFRMRNDNNIYQYFYNGAGVAVLNLNGDSLPDVYMTGNIVPDKLFLNEGNMKFKDVTAEAGILTTKKGWSTGVSIVDINNDGFDDIYVCRSRWKDSLANLLYVNNGNGTFTEKAKEYGIDAPDTYTIMANFFDYDKDGDLDLFLANHPTDWIEKMRFNNLEKIENHTNQSDRLFRNDNGHFVNVSKESGIDTHGYGLSCTVADFNGDTWPDLYVANDFAMHDYYFINQGNGKFKESAREVLKKTSLFGMGADVGDINNDGYPDIFVVDMKFDHSYVRRSFMLAQRRAEFNNMVSSGYHYQYVRNMLQLNNGNGTFSEIACMAGVDATEWSWAPLLVDLDNDGYQDLFVSNGYYKTFNIDERELIQGLKDATRRGDSAMFSKISAIINKKKLKDPNVVFKNNGDLTFTRMTNEWGFNQPTITHGSAFADFDRDGDIDIISSNTEQSPFIYRNNEAQTLKHNFIEFRFSGSEKNKKGIGADVHIYTKNGLQYQTNHIVRGYQSTSEDLMHFGLGDVTTVDKVVVTWLDGKTQTLSGIASNQIITLKYADANEKAPEQAKPNVLFTNVTDKLKIDFKHEEDAFDDFKRELLLPEKNSYFGPGLAIGDVNGDGLDDFFVGGATRQSGALYLQTANGEFAVSTGQPWASDKASDEMGVLFFDADGDKDLDLYVATGGSQFNMEDKNYRDHLYLNDGTGKFSSADKALPDLFTSGSCVVAGDYDNDGDLDLFVGGRLTPQHYPTPAKSVILKNDQGKFTDVTASVAPSLEKAGLVCSALWTDFDNDQKLDLLLGGEWMPVTFLKNNNGKFDDVTAQTGLQNMTGWWNSMVSGDFDNDGDVDYIAGNEGLNTRYYKPSEKEPIDLYSYDFDKNGTNDVVMSFYNFGQSYPVKNLQYSAEQMPVLAKEFKTYSGFALSSTNEIYGPKGLDKAFHLTASTLASSYIENLGNGKFAMRALPMRAQVSSMFGMLTYDVNSDGNLDLMYHGNFYNKESETERNDAFIGEILLGDGKGNFTYLPSRESGFFSDKDAKALAVISVGKNQTSVILGTNNNDKMFAYQLNANNSKVKYTEQDKYADIYLKDGRKIRCEMNFGSGFLSENSKEIAFIPSLTQKVMITDYKNQTRTVFQAEALAAK
ncbi:MAG: VCBS repeat-containing protein [Chitinophagaceae bacterium]|nr:VCBS repeat-containing protein [Chitinophagaceae bacterium]